MEKAAGFPFPQELGPGWVLGGEVALESIVFRTEKRGTPASPWITTIQGL